MSKTLICIRHGKAEDGFGIKDFDRSLHSKGEIQAELTAKRLLKYHFQVEQILYSTSLRTTSTAQIIASKIGYHLNDAISSRKLYLCTPNELENFIAIHADTTANTIVVIGHNNGLSDWINNLLHLPLYHTLSTCEFAAIRLDISSWEQVVAAPKAELICFESPKTKH